MTPEEALRRTREAEETGALELDFSGRKEGKTGARQYSGPETLNRLPQELASSPRPLLPPESQ
jgi:hypothetical protein